MMKQRLLGASLLVILLSACQTPPTKVKESTGVVEDAASFAARILEAKPVIVDVRSEIDFGVSRIPGSVNVRPGDLNSTKPNQSGRLDSDRFALARRMALWGIDPQKPVLVVGLGPEGIGEEGRVAWAFRLLGVEQVETASVRLFRMQNPREGESGPENRPIWKPQARNDLEISPEQFKKLAFEMPAPVTKARKAALGGAAHLGSVPARVIVDLSHPNERKVRTLEQMKPVWPVVRSSWRAFYDEHGRGSCSRAVKELQKVNVTPQHEILTYDFDGIGAAAVGFVIDSCRLGQVRVLSAGAKAL